MQATIQGCTYGIQTVFLFEFDSNYKIERVVFYYDLDDPSKIFADPTNDFCIGSWNFLYGSLSAPDKKGVAPSPLPNPGRDIATDISTFYDALSSKNCSFAYDYFASEFVWEIPAGNVVATTPQQVSDIFLVPLLVDR